MVADVNRPDVSAPPTAPTTHDLKCWPEPFAALLDGKSWWYPGTADPEAASVLSIRNHARLSGIEWRLPPAAAREQR